MRTAVPRPAIEGDTSSVCVGCLDRSVCLSAWDKPATYALYAVRCNTMLGTVTLGAVRADVWMSFAVLAIARFAVRQRLGGLGGWVSNTPLHYTACRVRDSQGWQTGCL
jgi:hypothetical protein